VEYLAFDKFYGWFQDITDVAGFTHSRRSFLNIQIEIEHAQNMEQIWENICRALELMRFDRGELYIYYSMDNTMSEPTSVAATDYDGMERRRVSVNGPNGGNEIRTARNENRQGIVRTWTLGHNRRHEDISYKKLFRVEIPLNAGETCMGMLVLMKDVVLNPLRPHTLRRVEYLRRSITAAMKEIKK
jgi:UDP-GlcNAc:undecaprenyl-phosphate GlcNAc-1-phosphate transferase